MFLFIFSIDASKEDGSLGRLVNDNHKSPNCVMKKVTVNNRPHLCLFAVRNIEVGTELDYNYGDSKWPWRQKVMMIMHWLHYMIVTDVSFTSHNLRWNENIWVIVRPVFKVYFSKKKWKIMKVPFILINETVYTRLKPALRTGCVGAKEICFTNLKIFHPSMSLLLYKMHH